LKVLAVGSGGGGVGDCTLTTDRKQKNINRRVVVFNCEAIVSFTSVHFSFLKFIHEYPDILLLLPPNYHTLIFCLVVRKLSNDLPHILSQPTPTTPMSEFIRVIQPFPHLAQARAKLNAFTSDTTRELQADVSNHQTFLRQARSSMAELRAEQAELRIQSISVEEEMNRGQRMEGVIRTEIDQLHEQSSDLPKRLHEIREREDQIRAEVQRLEAEVEASVDKNEQDNSDLTQGVIAFKNRLGLDFQRIGQDQLKLNMTNIDRNDPDRIFSFAVQIDPNDHYHVILCEPQLPNVDELVGVLNANNDFSKFVRSMRQAFCTLPGVAR
jgi:hypothetical protein